MKNAVLVLFLLVVVSSIAFANGAVGVPADGAIAGTAEIGIGGTSGTADTGTAGGSHCWHYEDPVSVTMNLDFSDGSRWVDASTDDLLRFYVSPGSTLRVEDISSFVSVCVDGASTSSIVAVRAVLVDGEERNEIANNYIANSSKTCDGGVVHWGDTDNFDVFSIYRGSYKFEIEFATNLSATNWQKIAGVEVIAGFPEIEVSLDRQSSFIGGEKSIYNPVGLSATGEREIIWVLENNSEVNAKIVSVNAVGCANIACEFPNFNVAEGITVLAGSSVLFPEKISMMPSFISPTLKDISLSVSYKDEFGFMDEPRVTGTTITYPNQEITFKILAAALTPVSKTGNFSVSEGQVAAGLPIYVQVCTDSQVVPLADTLFTYTQPLFSVSVFNPADEEIAVASFHEVDDCATDFSGIGHGNDFGGIDSFVPEVAGDYSYVISGIVGADAFYSSDFIRIGENFDDTTNLVTDDGSGFFHQDNLGPQNIISETTDSQTFTLNGSQGLVTFDAAQLPDLATYSEKGDIVYNFTDVLINNNPVASGPVQKVSNGQTSLILSSNGSPDNSGVSAITSVSVIEDSPDAPVIIDSKKAAIFLLVDASNSMNGDPFDREKQAVSSFISFFRNADQANLNVEENLRLGIITFAGGGNIKLINNSNLEFLTQEYADSLNSALANERTYDGTPIDKAIDFASQKYAEKNLDSTWRKIVVLMTDGKPSSINRTKNSADFLKVQGVEVYVIGLENGRGAIDHDLLRYVSSNPDSKYYHFTTELNQFELLYYTVAQTISNELEFGTGEIADVHNMNLLTIDVEKYLLEFNGGQLGICSTFDGVDIGTTGESPRIDYDWKVANNPVLETACGGNDFTVCDSTQFTMVIIDRLNKIQAAAEAGNFETAANLTLPFTVNLMRDGLTSDFVSDFDIYMSSNFFTNQLGYYDSTTGEGWANYLTSPSRFDFEVEGGTGDEFKILSKPGKYRVILNIDFADDKPWKFFDPASGDPVATIKVELSQQGDFSKNLLYYLPIDGSVGIKDGLMHRDGYGVGFVNSNPSKSINLCSTCEGASNASASDLLILDYDSSSTPLEIINVEQKDSFAQINKEVPARILFIKLNPSDGTYNLEFSPSIAFPAIIEGYSDGSGISAAYNVLAGSSHVDSGTSMLRREIISYQPEGQATDTAVCGDPLVEGQLLPRYRGIDSLRSGTEFCSVQSTQSPYVYGFNESPDAGVPAGSVAYYQTIVYRPVDFSANISLRNSCAVIEDGKGNIYLAKLDDAGQIIGNDVIPRAQEKALSNPSRRPQFVLDFLEKIPENTVCISNGISGTDKPDSVGLWWNEGKLLSDFREKFGADDAINACYTPSS